ncbi:MAG: anhydro-N-acetylmuramic acid kinase [Betaproteobacteria bacterium]|nr:anhydro-N-acetylmuramic acid kinase [Betaproteobacteria bacterium]
MPELYIGLMSGTSLDGIDAVLAAPRGNRFRILTSLHRPYPAALRRRLLVLHEPGRDELHRAAIIANELTAAYAAAVRAVIARAATRARAVAAIGCHGQTIRHRPDAGYTLQLANGALLAELTGITVACDFRSRDIAAGGEGAPLVPAFHHALFASARRGRAVVNVGGIANMTCLPARGKVTGFDCGPGNCLLDAWTMERRRKPFDRNGAWAARGNVLPRLLGKLLSHPFFRRQPPKSTGRETFNLAWVKRTLTGNQRAADVQATLLELTATSIARAVRTRCTGAREIYICGGGARNRALLERLAALLPGRRIATTAALGLAPEHVEALAFAWLARQALKGKPGNLPAVTGARGPRVLGAIYPA